MAIIQTKQLTKRYGTARGITELSLSIETGEFFGFIGPNGAGKSTTIRTLLGLISPTSGTAEVLGQNITDRRHRYLSEVGYLPSEAMFYNSMKVGELIALSAKLRKKDCSAEAARLCERLALDINKRIDALSLGNRKKLGIVCALQHKPKLYILDEPTSGLDPLMQKEFFLLLQERHRDGATILLSSHVLAEVQRHCSRAAIINNGKLVRVDDVASLCHTNTRRVMLHGITALPETINAKSVTVAEDSVNFLYQGDIKQLLEQLRTLPFDDISIAEPELEEVFLHYYETEGAQ